jgi:hypothetical protein
MSEKAQCTLTILIHESVNAMAIRQEGRITRMRSTKPGTLWAEPRPRRTMENLSLACCKETCIVLRTEIRL